MRTIASIGCSTRSCTASAASSAVLGMGSGTQGSLGGGPRSESGDRSNNADAINIPEMPSANA